VQIDGVIVDARQLPAELQAEARRSRAHPRPPTHRSGLRGRGPQRGRSGRALPGAEPTPGAGPVAPETLAVRRGRSDLADSRGFCFYPSSLAISASGATFVARATPAACPARSGGRSHWLAPLGSLLGPERAQAGGTTNGFRLHW
jgi:hypothetical protein